MDKRFMAVVAALILGFLGIAFLTSPDSDGKVEDVRGQQFIEQVKATPHEEVEYDKVRGAGSVTIVEWADFECPACRSFYPSLKAIEEEYPDDVKVVFRHFPIDAIHPLAKSAHIAAEAADRQGKFWEMHDLLFEQALVWTNSNNVKETMIDFAGQLEMDTEKFKADYEDPLTRDFIQASQKAGGDQGVNSTPTIYVNGEQYSAGAVNPDLIASILAEDSADDSEGSEESAEGEAGEGETGEEESNSTE